MIIIAMIINITYYYYYRYNSLTIDIWMRQPVLFDAVMSVRGPQHVHSTRSGAQGGITFREKSPFSPATFLAFA